MRYPSTSTGFTFSMLGDFNLALPQLQIFTDATPAARLG